MWDQATTQAAVEIAGAVVRRINPAFNTGGVDGACGRLVRVIGVVILQIEAVMMALMNESRREFLKNAAVLGTAAMVPGLLTNAGTADAVSAAADEPAKSARVSFGFSLYGMRKLSVSKALSVCSEIGYDGVELVANKDWPCAPESLSAKQRREIRKQLADSGLQVTGLMENLRLAVDGTIHRDNLERLKRAGELAHDLSPKSPPPIETVLGGKPAEWKAVKGRMTERLKEWAKVAESSKTVIAIKAHVGGALHRSDDARRMVDAIDSRWIRLAYDYSHFQLWGEKLAESLKNAIDRTVFIHVKDSSGKLGKFRFLLPGQGSIDYGRYFALLKQHGYRGPLVVEVSGQIHGRPGYDPVAAAKTSYGNLAGKLKAAGLRDV